MGSLYELAMFALSEIIVLELLEPENPSARLAIVIPTWSDTAG
jgi:hypothetical protein